MPVIYFEADSASEMGVGAIRPAKVLVIFFPADCSTARYAGSGAAVKTMMSVVVPPPMFDENHRDSSSARPLGKHSASREASGWKYLADFFTARAPPPLGDIRSKLCAAVTM